tara:strand:+ start:223 stop:726 length:504 start_codon:yes stop_codon:yes gene_type:complete
MTQIEFHEKYVSPLPLDIIEEFVNTQGWHINRLKEEEITAIYNGKWCDYSLHFAWLDRISAINFTCAFDVRIPEKKISLIHTLIALINDKLWLGHFCIWQQEALPTFRYTFPLRGNSNLTPQQTEDVLETTIITCEKFYPAFQYVMWGGKNPKQALEATLLEPLGEA